MKTIRRIFCFIFCLALMMVLMVYNLIIYIIISNSIVYAKYDETGVMKNGNLCISHMCEGGGGNAEEYYNSNNSVLQEVKEFYVTNGIGLGIGDTTGDVFGRVYKPINYGTSDIYVGYGTFGGESINHFELYHIEVDKDLNITYSIENIDKERFEQYQK